MVHLRIVAPDRCADQVLELLEGEESVVNVVALGAVSRKPAGELVLCDVAREDASILLGRLKALGVTTDGSIMVEDVDTVLSQTADAAVRHAPGDPSDAVVWEEVEARTSEQSELSWSFLVFVVLAGLIVGCGILLDSEITIVGGMVVGPEFGPIAGFCVALVSGRRRLAGRSFLALAVGLPVAALATLAMVLVLKATGVSPDEFSAADHRLADVIAQPDGYSVVIALSAGVVGMLSLSTAKSGALIGVLISVTTIPAVANIGVAAAYGDGEAFRGSLGNLVLNVACLLLAGSLTLWVQRRAFRRRRAEHGRRAVRAAA